MGNAHRRGVLLHVLPAWPRRGIDVRLQVGGIDLDLDVVDLRQHSHRRRGGVDAALGLGGGNPLHAVHAALPLEPAVDALAADGGDALLDAAAVGFLQGERLELPALRLRVAHVHPEEVAGPTVSARVQFAPSSLDT